MDYVDEIIYLVLQSMYEATKSSKRQAIRLCQIACSCLLGWQQQLD
jgi:hypothetical protein